MLEARLKVLSGKHVGKTVSLASGKFLIGREKDCHLRPASDLVSRHHCVFYLDGFGVRLRDLGSRNGTFVNGSQLNGETSLSDGDHISVGSLEFRLTLNKSDSPPNTETPASESVLGDSGLLDTVSGSGGDTAYEVQVSPNSSDNTIVLPASAATPVPAEANPGQPNQVASQPDPQQMQGYPQQQPYPQQGYPGYPPPGMQMPYYPPYQQGYPPQGYPYAPYPMPGYPMQQPGPQQEAPPQQESNGSTNKIPALPVKLPPPPER